MSGTITKSELKMLGHDGSWMRDLIKNYNLLITDLETVRRANQSVALSTSGLAIKAGGSALAKAVTAFRYVAAPSGTPTGAPVLGLVAANTDVAAFAGSVTSTKFNVFVHTLVDDGAGTQTLATKMGTEGATRAAVVFPALVPGEVVYGITEIHPTGTGPFVGGTTALDDATVVPNATFVSVVGALPGIGFAKSATALTGAQIGDSTSTTFTG